MNVLFLTHSYPRAAGDAAGSFILHLAQALAAEGVTVNVVAPGADGLPDHEMLGGVQVERFRYAPRKFETLAYGGNMAAQVEQSWTARVTLLGFLGSEFQSAIKARRDTHPDLVHAHWWFPNGLAGTWLSRMSNVPLVTTLHGTDVRMVRGVSMSRPAFRHVMKHSAAVTAVSTWLADEAQSIVSIKRPIVAPMPVATELFLPREGNERSRRLLFVGRLMPQKGLDLLIQALPHLPADVGLDVVGDGPDKMSLMTLASKLDVADRIEWHGAVKQTELPPFYQRALALVVPSALEGLGLVAVEAQLCETPVVGMRSGGLTDVIQHDRTGLLVGERDPLALASGINALLDRADSGRSLGAAGRLFALSNFAPESVARRYADIYRGVLERGKT